MSGDQSGFGFAPTFGAPRRAAKRVTLRRCDLFWMVEDNSGVRPVAPATWSVSEAAGAARVAFPAAVVVFDGFELGARS